METLHADLVQPFVHRFDARTGAAAAGGAGLDALDRFGSDLHHQDTREGACGRGHDLRIGGLLLGGKRRRLIDILRTSCEQGCTQEE